MIAAFFNGIGFGLLLALMVGPVFFGLLQTSLSKGFIEGIKYAVGVSFSDLSYIFLTYLGVSILLTNPVFKQFINLSGGIIMIAFGIFYLLKPDKKSSDVFKHETKSSYYAMVSQSFAKGFILNFLTPSVWIFWIGTMSIVSVNYGQSISKKWLFFTGVLITLLLTDLTKAYVAHKLKRILNKRLLENMNKIVGIIFIVAGLLIFLKD